jgi:hypothetical protein
MHVYWLVHMTVIHYSALYDTEEGTHIHDHSLSLVGTDTSIKLVVVNLVF